ncbi:MAG TPA: UDP-N-acetylmuramate--L-alanine ligase [Thermomicrobiales bacterium]|nr:UDP-N-acetylmuramate--L-alanine ligase [Thermomicrobiales bacterium]
MADGRRVVESDAVQRDGGSRPDGQTLPPASPHHSSLVTRHSSLPDTGARVHIVGVGGIGTSALARVLLAWGYRVSGSDAAASALTAALAAEGVAVTIGHRAEAAAGADLVVYSAAVRDDNPELVAARAAGVPAVKRAELLGLIASARTCLAVAGTHGKSTTTAMLAKIAADAGRDPTFFVGAIATDFGTNARPGQGDLVVVEADEYDRSFLQLRPRVAIVTTIEHDHPDTYPTYEDVLDAFDEFVGQVEPGGAVVLAADDPGCRALLARRPAPDGVAVVTFGHEAGADWRLEPTGDGAQTVLRAGAPAATLRLALPGEHNRRNALAAIAAAARVGIAPMAAATALATFRGTGRRFEFKGEAAGVAVVDDYAHHPTEVAVNLNAARERFAGRPLWAVFQPHTYSRTKLLLREFAAALSAADRVVLLDIYAARERDTLGVSADDLAALLPAPPLRATTPAEAAALLLDRHRAGELAAGAVVLTLGAGDVWRAGEGLLHGLREARGG